MADSLRMALTELVRKAELEEDTDLLREGVRVLSQALMEMEASEHVGARRYERTACLPAGRQSGRVSATGIESVGGTRGWGAPIMIGVPRVRDGSYFPSLLEPRRRAERALVGVVQEAYIQGVSTRRVDELVRSLGMEGISKSQASRLCQELDVEVEGFRSRKLEGPYPYVWLDATFVKVREDGRVVSQAVPIHRDRGESQRGKRGVGVGYRA